MPEGYTFDIKNNLEVTLIGPREAFNSFDQSLMTATVDYDNITVNEDGSYSAEATVVLGGEHTGIYVQNKHYNVSFSISAPSVSPGDDGEPIDPNDVSDVEIP